MTEEYALRVVSPILETLSLEALLHIRGKKSSLADDQARFELLNELLESHCKRFDLIKPVPDTNTIAQVIKRGRYI